MWLNLKIWILHCLLCTNNHVSIYVKYVLKYTTRFLCFLTYLTTQYCPFKESILGLESFMSKVSPFTFSIKKQLLCIFFLWVREAIRKLRRKKRRMFYIYWMFLKIVSDFVNWFLSSWKRLKLAFPCKFSICL